MNIDNEKIATAITKIDALRTTDGLFGKCDAILKLNPVRWNQTERLELLNRITARCKHKGLRDTMRDVYGRQIRGER